jgi:hypothetical protein
MKLQLHGIGAVILAGLWINASEFLRNEVFLLSFWTGQYKSLGLIFPNDPVNGILWMVWGVLYAVAIYLISRKFTLVQTTFLSWFVGFVLMWITLANLNVLPIAMLPYAVPLSLLESFVGALICFKISPNL